MRIPLIGSAGRGQARSTRASTAVLVLASVALLATGLVTPVAGAAPTAGARGHLGRTVGTGVRVDATESSRAAVKAPRIHKALDRRVVKLGARPSSKGTKPATSALSPASGSAGIGVGPRISDPALNPKITTTFPGITRADTCSTSCEPPDPWIAVSPSYVVQSTNGMVRMSNRAGSTLLNMPTWALFLVPVERSDSDPRILWDAVHGRWVGVLVTYNAGFTQNGLRLAVSRTANPTGGWTIYAIETLDFLPDYPGISSSGDKVVLTSDDFDGTTFAGPTFYVMDWSNILAETLLFVGGIAYPSATAHFRPALMLSSAPNVPVIYERADGKPGYFEIAGTAHAFARVNDRDLGGSYGLATFADPLTQPQPVQPGGVTIAEAVDERPTDAVYRDGQLWFVATGDYFDTVNHWTQARYSRVSTTANNTAPSAAFDLVTQMPSHYFMPGIGISGNGTAFLTATVTDATRFPTSLVAAVLPTLELTDFSPVEASTEAYIGSRWGDYVGVAADPAGSGAAWFSHQVVSAGGGWRTSVARVVSDATQPSVPGIVIESPVIPAGLGVTIPIKTSWAASTDAGSGVKSYIVERSDDGGAFVAFNTPVPAITQPLPIGHFVQYRVSAVDDAGNVGVPRYGPTFRPSVFQQRTSTVYAGTWGAQLSARFSGGSTKYAIRAGRYVTFTATSARSIAFVTTKARSRGLFRVYVDGHLRATVSAYSAITRYRQILFQYSWATPGTHRIRIYVLGTRGHPRVDVDAFVVLR
jgi:hypothetical protein